jgi:magnesium transporter
MSVDPLVANGRVTFQTAEEQACAQVPVFSPMHRAEHVRQALVGHRYDSVSHIVVCEGDKFLGILTIEDLLAAPAETLVGSLMDREAPTVGPGVDQEVAAWQAARNEEAALAVVDQEGRFVGIIPPHRLLAVLLSEHEEDLSRLGGFLKSSSAALQAPYSVAPRGPWGRSTCSALCRVVRSTTPTHSHAGLFHPGNRLPG